MTTTSRSRVGAGVPAGGEFKATAHSDVVPALGVPATTPATLPVGELIEVEAARYGAGYRDRMEAQYARLATDGGRTLFTQHLDARANPETRYDSRAIQGVQDTADYDRLAELGYTDVNQLSEVRRKNLRGLETVLEHAITPERLAVLGAQPRHEFQWSAWEKEAYLTAPLSELEAALGKSRPAGDQYAAAIAIGHPERAARFAEARSLGVGDRGLIEATQHPLPVLASLYNNLPASGANALNVVTYADNGITGEHLKSYGPRACTRFDGPSLDASGLEPQTVRAFMSAGFKGGLGGMKTLHDGGFRTAKDLEAARGAMGSDDPAVLARARRRATGEQLQKFRSTTPFPLTPADANAIGLLVRQGFTDPESLRPYTSAICPESAMLEDRKRSPYAVYAGFQPAGITPAKLGELTRAGIPASQAHNFADTQDAWADGARFRAEYAERQAALTLSYPRGWPYTEATFKNGK